jgi:peptidoglycan/LPS O-acetylase OafA/YrhL
MLLHGGDPSLIIVFWGVVLGLNLFGGWACLFLLQSRPRPPRLLPALMAGACVSAAVVLITASDGGFDAPDLLVLVAVLPSVLLGAAVVLWFVRPVRAKRRLHRAGTRR